MSLDLHLAPPLTQRPLRPDDAATVCGLVRRCEEHDIGEPQLDLEDIVSEWQRPSFDLATQSIGVYDGDTLIASAEVSLGRRADADVEPAHRGRGIGSALVAWTEQVARDCDGSLVGQSVPEGSSADRLLRAHGYEEMWTSWLLALPVDTALSAPALPDGVRLRAFEPERDEQAVYQVIEDAFNEWPDRDPTAYDDWVASVLNRPGFHPWQLLLAVEDADVVGACSLVISDGCAFISQLAVRRDRRGLGLGRALLLEGFSAGRAHGAQRAELSTDSRTGALGLYLHVGMEVRYTFVHLAKQLG